MADFINATDSLNEGRKKLNAIAKEMNDKDVASMPEIVNARDGEPSLKARLDRVAEQQNRKINEMTSGTPKIVAETYGDLPPVGGEEKIALVIEDGRKYYDNGTQWTDAGVYQATEFPEVDILAQEIELIKNGELSYNFVRGEFVASASHASGEGTINYGADAYGLTEPIIVFQGDVITIEGGGTSNILILSEWSSSGSFLRSIIEGENRKSKYSYTVEKPVEYLRITHNFNQYGEPKIYGDSELSLRKLDEDISDVYTFFTKEKKPVNHRIENGYIASANHATYPEGMHVSATSHRVAILEPLKKGEILKIAANSSLQTAILSKWSESDEYIETLIQGDSSTRNHEYTVKDEIEYLKVTNGVSQLPMEDFKLETLNEYSVPLIYKKISEIETGGGGGGEGEGIKTPVMPPEAIRKPVINFSFDDGLETDANLVREFDKFGFRCGFGLITSKSNRVDEYLDYQSRGYEILSHSHNHISFSNSTEQTLEGAETQFRQSKEILESQGFKIRGWITPMSQMKDEFIPLLRKYYEYGFTQYLGAWNSNNAESPSNSFEDDTLKLKRVSAEASSAQDCIDAIDKTIAEGGMLSFYGHGFPGTLTSDDLEQILTHLRTRVDNGDCLVLTPAEAYEHYYTLRHSDLLQLMSF